jgi:LemA protein
MPLYLFLWFVLAIVFFWAYGLLNRLARIRNRGLGALGSLDQAMRQYQVLVQAHLGETSEDLPPRWQRLMDMLHLLEGELNDVRSTPLTDHGLGRLWRQYEAMQTAWTSLVRAPIDVAGMVVPDSLRENWDAVTLKVMSARGGVNGILGQYNEAVTQRPARWLARLLGYRPVGLL